MKKILAGAAVLVTAVAMSATAAVAAENVVVVTPTNASAKGWSTADTRPGGAVNFVADDSAPAGKGALQLTTDDSNEAKAQFMHEANTKLSDVSELGYYTKQNSASFPGGDATYQLPVCLGGVTPSCTGFTTLVFEPYWQNGGLADAAPVDPGSWQSWNVADGGLFWSSRSYNDGNCSITAGGGGPPFYTLSDLQEACPAAVAVGFGVSIGTYNSSYDVESDLVDFNGTVYDFEQYQVASSGDQCNKNGWQSLASSDGSGFKNQGDCIQYVNTGK